MATLVVVDDESLVTDFLTFLLESEGHSVHAAANGRQALEIVDRVHPALVITDLMMPVMPGLELARTLRESVAFSHLPIILCSSVSDPVALHEQHLFTAILRKPYAPARLVQLVDENTDPIR
ncbi:response regulator [Paraburkholderia sp. BCC1886]|uniref:response regulator n=1 Tax=Paraburkholderia sp. BCC1886 TaxID=2562670 RepID=UPI001183D1A2|nr:response regulator [Paraburkholderia sp. BCC1886]